MSWVVSFLGGGIFNLQKKYVIFYIFYYIAFSRDFYCMHKYTA